MEEQENVFRKAALVIGYLRHVFMLFLKVWNGLLSRFPMGDHSVLLVKRQNGRTA
jgi:hypothetical protein